MTTVLYNESFIYRLGTIIVQNPHLYTSTKDLIRIPITTLSRHHYEVDYELHLNGNQIQTPIQNPNTTPT